MFRAILLPISSLGAAMLLAGAPGATPQAAAPVPTVIEAKPIRQAANPESRMEGREAAEAAVAGALVGVANEQFSGERIQVRIEQMRMEAASPRDRSVSGQGQLKVGDEEDWLPFRFRAHYDSETQAAAWASMTLGQDDIGGVVVQPRAESALALQREALDRLQREFSQQKVRLDLANIRQLPAGGRYQRFLATGLVHFDRQPQGAEARVEGLYDTRAGRWVRVAYELGGGSQWVEGEEGRTAGL